MTTRNLETYLYLISEKLAKIPELEPVIAIFNTQDKLFGSKPEVYILHEYNEYLHIIGELQTLSHHDLEIITIANRLSTEQHISKNSASKGGADYFIEKLGASRQKQLLSAVRICEDPITPVFQTALDDLSRRLLKGHQLAIAGETIKDGASADADYAIWGHTKSLGTEAMIHFVMTHFLERVFTAYFACDEDEAVHGLISQKDTLLSAMGDVLLLRNAQGLANPKIVKIWATSRSEGGLQWITSQRQAIFNTSLRRF